MLDERFSIQQNDEQMLLQRMQRLIESIGELWQHPYRLPSENLKRIIEFAVHFPEAYRAMALTKIAECLVDNMGLHFLDIMTTFQQKAEQEGIDREEREATFQDIMPELFPSMMRLSRNLSIHSLDDLIRLSNITFGLYGLSQVETAEEAERWIYTLPKVYHSQLEQDHLISSAQGQVTVTIRAEIVSPGKLQSTNGQPMLTFNLTSQIMSGSTTPNIILGGNWLPPGLRGQIMSGSTTPNIIDSTIASQTTALAA